MNRGISENKKRVRTFGDVTCRKRSNKQLSIFQQKLEVNFPERTERDIAVTKFSLLSQLEVL